MMGSCSSSGYPLSVVVLLSLAVLLFDSSLPAFAKRATFSSPITAFFSGSSPDDFRGNRKLQTRRSSREEVTVAAMSTDFASGNVGKQPSPHRRRIMENSGESLLSAFVETGRQSSTDGSGGSYYGFGSQTTGGDGGDVVYVTSFADSGPDSLRYWCGLPGKRIIKFQEDCTITLNSRVECTNDKTVDGSGYKVRITGWGLSANRVSNVVFKNLCIANTKLDGVTIRLSSDIVVQGCTITNTRDGGVDVITQSSGVSILNNHFVNQVKTILIGNSDSAKGDKNITVTVAFNYFDDCGSRLPRVRFAKVHVCSNVYWKWGAYAIGGSRGAQLLVENSFFHPSKNKYVNNLHEGLNDGTVIHYKSNNFYEGSKLLLTHLGSVTMPHSCPIRDESTIVREAGVGHLCS